MPRLYLFFWQLDQGNPFGFAHGFCRDYNQHGVWCWPLRPVGERSERRSFQWMVTSQISSVGNHWIAVGMAITTCPCCSSASFAFWKFIRGRAGFKINCIPWPRAGWELVCKQALRNSLSHQMVDLETAVPRELVNTICTQRWLCLKYKCLLPFGSIIDQLEGNLFCRRYFRT